jgi:hypothetical protein
MKGDVASCSAVGVPTAQCSAAGIASAACGDDAARVTACNIYSAATSTVLVRSRAAGDLHTTAATTSLGCGRTSDVDRVSRHD